MKRAAILGLLAMSALLVLTSCGGGAAEPTVHEITVTLTEYQFDPGEITFTAGEEVHLTLVNDGFEEHEILIGRDPGEGYGADFFDHDPSKVEATGDEGFHVGSEEEIAEEGYHVEVEPGSSGTLVFLVPEDKVGEWEMGCFINEGVHYDNGMHGKVTVLAP